MTETAPLAPTEPPENSEPLLFNSFPIAFVMFDDVPFFSLADLCTAMNWTRYAAEVVERPAFPEHAKRIALEHTDAGKVPVTVLSPVGIWLWGHLNDAGKTQGIAAWAKREAAKLCPEPRAGDPGMFLTMMADGELPPRPLKYSGRRSEWLNLIDANPQTAPIGSIFRRGYEAAQRLQTAQATRPIA